MYLVGQEPTIDANLRPALVDAKACAAYLNISERTWLRLVANGKAPAPVKVGRLTRWRIAELEAYVAGL